MSRQRYQFDKFMKNIIKKEKSTQNTQEENHDNPAREYRRLYSERWQNRIIWRRGHDRA